MTATTTKQKDQPHAKAAALVTIVQARITEKPFEFDGQTWAAEPQEWWDEQLGVSTPTLRRIIGKPPFIRNWARVNGVVTTLLRVGVKAPPTNLDRAKIMRHIWYQKLGKNKDTVVANKRWGCLYALAKEWGEHAPTIFALVLNNWPLFMGAVKTVPEWTNARHFKFPNIPVIRRFHYVAWEQWVMKLQEEAGNKANAKDLWVLYHTSPGLAA